MELYAFRDGSKNILKGIEFFLYDYLNIIF